MTAYTAHHLLPGWLNLSPYDEDSALLVTHVTMQDPIAFSKQGIALQ